MWRTGMVRWAFLSCVLAFLGVGLVAGPAPVDAC
jgi:hypothetical protein